MTSLPFAAIDVGSNTIRIIVASKNGGNITRHFVDQKATRLGQGLVAGAPLSFQAVARTMETLKEFKKDIIRSGAQKTLIGATSAVREAADGAEFMSRVKAEFGFDTVTLTGSQEADLTAAGVLTAIPTAEALALIFDLGGRSTEFILSESGQIRTRVSLSLGAVKMTEDLFLNHPPALKEIENLKTIVRAILEKELSADFKKLKSIQLIGTAGTTTTLAAMAQKMTKYIPDQINNYVLKKQKLEALIEKLAILSVEERADLPGLPKDRADIILAGALIVYEIVNFFNSDKITVSDAGLLEGLWLVSAGLRRI